MRLRVSGEIDLATGAELCDSIVFAAEQAGRVEVDAQEVSFLDSSGIAALVAAQRRAMALGSRVVVTAASEQAAQVLRLTGVAPYLGLGSEALQR